MTQSIERYTMSQFFRDIEISVPLLKLQRCDKAIEKITVTNHREIFQTQGRIISASQNIYHVKN